jgi:hypothetical protein
MIVMEDLNGIRNSFKKSKNLNKRFHSLPFNKLQAYIEYKANLEGIGVRYLTKRRLKTHPRNAIDVGMLPELREGFTDVKSVGRSTVET